jgi:hypothetical protein
VLAAALSAARSYFLLFLWRSSASFELSLVVFLVLSPAASQHTSKNNNKKKTAGGFAFLPLGRDA